MFKLFSIAFVAIMLALAMGTAVPVSAGALGNDATASIMKVGDQIQISANREELYVQGDSQSGYPNQTLKGDKRGSEWFYSILWKSGSYEVKFAAKLVFPNSTCRLSEGTTTWFDCNPRPATSVPSLPANGGVITTPVSGGADYNLYDNDGKYHDCAMWRISPVNLTMTWVGGSSFVHTCFNDAAKVLLKSGFTAVFTMSVPWEVRTCRAYWNGMDLNGNQMNFWIPGTCVMAQFRAGTYSVSGWAFDPLCGEQIGFRAIPSDATPGWGEEKTCQTCVWPFPQGSNPTYLSGGLPRYSPAPPANTSYSAPVVADKQSFMNALGACMKQMQDFGTACPFVQQGSVAH